MLLLSCSCRSPSLEITQGQNKLKGTSFEMLVMYFQESTVHKNKATKKKETTCLPTPDDAPDVSEVQDYGTACFNGNNPALTSASLISVEHLSKFEAIVLLVHILEGCKSTACDLFANQTSFATIHHLLSFSTFKAQVKAATKSEARRIQEY